MGEGGTNGQTLTFTLSTDNDGLFVAGGEPAIAPATVSFGHLTYTPAPGSKGTANITVILKDNGQTETVTGTSVTSSADPKQDTKNFTIIVEPFPEVVSVTPAPGADNVPIGIKKK